jgi:hypothetical protein
MMEQPDQLEQPEQLGRPGRPDQPEQLEQPEQALKYQMHSPCVPIHHRLGFNGMFKGT